MCILIKQNKGHTFTDEEIADFYNHNQDGFGVMFRDGYYHKGYYTLEAVKEIYKLEAAGKECFLHFRMRTSGILGDKNCHPYFFKGYLLMHNGVLGGSHNENSDTRNFINKYLIKQPELINKKWFRQLLQRAIGSNNKFAIITPQGKQYIINKSYGTIYKGTWYSNTYAWSYPPLRNQYIAYHQPMLPYREYNSYYREFDNSLDKPEKNKQLIEESLQVAELDESLLDDILYNISEGKLAELETALAAKDTPAIKSIIEETIPNLAYDTLKKAPVVNELEKIPDSVYNTLDRGI